MAVAQRSDGRFEVFIYDAKRRKAGGCAKRYIGRFGSRAEAEAVERAAKLDAYVHAPPRAPKWGVKNKREPDCRNCGAPATRLHHIVPRASVKDRRLWNSPLHNGLPLCCPCHIGWHHNSLVIHREALHPEELAFAMNLMGPAWLDRYYPAKQLYQQEINEAMLDELVLLRDQNRSLRRRILELEESAYMGRNRA